MKNKFELAIWRRAIWKATCAKPGGNNFGMMLKTSLECSILNIGVVGAVGYSPDPNLGLKHTFSQVLGVLIAIRA